MGGIQGHMQYSGNYFYWPAVRANLPKVARDFNDIELINFKSLLNEITFIRLTSSRETFVSSA